MMTLIPIVVGVVVAVWKPQTASQQSIALVALGIAAFCIGYQVGSDLAISVA